MVKMQTRATTVTVVLVFFSTISCSNAQQPIREIDFDLDVRPILADRCYACHGPDEHSREADLRLDQPESALGTKDAGAAIVPGKPDESELVRRIGSDDPDLQMPPPDFNKPLTSEEKKVLVRWISQGAKYEEHWSFVPPSRETLPFVKKDDWPRNAIDHFILARLEKDRILPSPTANRETLIRRVTLDLTGLPPMPKHIDAFLRDTRKDAYERLVDRLMTTTAYAERRTQDWLDLARYADTRGFSDDKMRAIWPWRDWVIRAIDKNMPFDQFTVEQLAGDMLPNASDEQRLATGFHRNAPQAKGMTYPAEEYRIKGVVDRVNTVGRVWLGLTMDCAQCHDHKFDPISQRDYYSMVAIFNNTEHSGMGFEQGGPTMTYRLASMEQGDRGLAELSRLKSELATKRKSLPAIRPIDEKRYIGKWNGATVESDRKNFSLKGNLTISAKIRTTQPVADIVSKYDWKGKQRGYVFGIGGEGDAKSVPGHLFFWASSRTESFDGVTVNSSYAVNDGLDHHVAVEFAAGRSVRLFIDGIEDKAARFNGSVPVSIARSNRSLAIGSGYSNSSEALAFQFTSGLSDVRLSDQLLGDEISIGSDGDKVTEILTAIEKLDSRKGPEEMVAKVPVMRERSHSRETFIHIRGNFLDHGEQVFPGAPEFFQVPESFPIRNRLEFARWLVSGKNPLVARVVVNRFWQNYFGHGLVRTPDDYGAHGTPPTHPLLLDWLATEFVESGWDMKRIHRLIVTSATYRQSTSVNLKAKAVDPENRLLAFMPRVRLPAEQIRDQALAVSGLLAGQVGGPPVFPVQPEGYWQRRVLPGDWTTSKGSDRHRKTMYTYWRRMALHPSLELLNAPARENCVVRRDVANIPTQALVLLNDPIFTEAAKSLAFRVVREVKGDQSQRLDYVFRLVLGRFPKHDEKHIFLRYLARQREGLSQDVAAVRALSGAAGGSNSTDVAVWILACSVLLNLDETITRP